MSIPSGPLVKLCFYTVNGLQYAMETIAVLTPYENFVFALKSKDSKRQYPNRLDRFLTFMGLKGRIEEKCVKLHQLGKNDINLLQSYLIRFINSLGIIIKVESIST
jgi:hypothetical protein